MADEVTFGSASALLVRKLIQARKERGFSLEEISAETRIKKDHLEKIEGGNLKFLPSAYVYAFLKEYAQALDVKDSELIERCRDELRIPIDLRVKQENETVKDEKGGGKGERLSGMFGAIAAIGDKVPASVVVGGVVFIVLVLLAVSFFVFSRPSGNEKTILQEESELVVPSVEIQPESEVAVPDSIALAGTLSEASPDELPELVRQEDWAKDVSFLPESSTSPYQKILIVRIIKDLSWVKIIADDGDMVYPGGRFEAGEVLRYEAKKKFWVNIGRPSFVELYLNGEKVSPMSKRTIVLGEE